MSKFRVHLYPHFRTVIEVAAADAAQAARNAEDAFLELVADVPGDARWGYIKMEYAEDYDSDVVVDSLDDSGEWIPGKDQVVTLP